MTAFTDLVGIELPVVQAGMGGGISGHALAVAVSEAGGLGTIGTLAPRALAGELAAARSATGRPVAVNLLLPLARRAHWEVAAGADAIVTFWGRPQRRAPGVWVHQCGSVAEARAAVAAGADAVIAQGVEAGGHVRGSVPALELLASVRAALPAGFPVLLAGGIAGADDVAAAITAGADAAVLGTRFVLSDESGAHPEYKRRLLEADETILTELFGAGWANAPHRVVANAATERWLRRGPRGPAAIRAVQRLTAPALIRLPGAITDRVLAAQRASSPMLSAQPPVAGGPEGLLDSGPLYAGQTVARIADVRPAGELTRELASRLG